MSSGKGPSAAASGGQADSIILEEEIDPNYVPTEDEVLEYAKWLGMDLDDDKDLFWIAKEGLKAPLPENWKPCKTTDTEEIYYFNFSSGESTWDHPCDDYYRKLYDEEKKKKLTRQKEKKNKKKQEEKKTVDIILAKQQAGAKDMGKLSLSSVLPTDTTTSTSTPLTVASVSTSNSHPPIVKRAPSLNEVGTTSLSSGAYFGRKPLPGIGSVVTAVGESSKDSKEDKDDDDSSRNNNNNVVVLKDTLSLTSSDSINNKNNVGSSSSRGVPADDASMGSTGSSKGPPKPTKSRLSKKLNSAIAGPGTGLLDQDTTTTTNTSNKGAAATVINVRGSASKDSRPSSSESGPSSAKEEGGGNTSLDDGRRASLVSDLDDDEDTTKTSYKKKYLALQQTVREYEDKLRDAEKRFRQEKRAMESEYRENLHQQEVRLAEQYHKEMESIRQEVQAKSSDEQEVLSVEVASLRSERDRWKSAHDTIKDICSKYEEQLEKYAAEVESHKKEVERLREQLISERQSADDEMDNEKNAWLRERRLLEDDARGLRSQVTEMKASLAKAEADRDKLRKDVAGLEEQVRKAKSSTPTSISSSSSSSPPPSSSGGSAAQPSSSKSPDHQCESMDKIEDMQYQMTMLQEKLSLAQRDSQKVLEDNRSLSKQLDQTVAELKRAKSDLRSQEQALSSSQRGREEGEARLVAQIDQAHKRMEEQAQIHKSRIAELESESRRLSEAVEQANAREAQVRSSLHTTQESLLRVTLEAEKIKEDMRATAATTTTSSSEDREVAEAKSRQEQSINVDAIKSVFESAMSSMKGELATSKAETARLQALLTQLNSENSQAVQALEEQRSVCARLEGEVRDLEEALQEEREQQHEADAHHERERGLAEESVALRQQVQKLDQEVTVLRSELSRAKANRDRLDAEKEVLQESRDQAEKDAMKARAEAEKHVQSLRLELESATCEVHSLRTELRDSQSRYQQDLERIKEETEATRQAAMVLSARTGGASPRLSPPTTITSTVAPSKTTKPDKPEKPEKPEGWVKPSMVKQLEDEGKSMRTKVAGLERALEEARATAEQAKANEESLKNQVQALEDEMTRLRSKAKEEATRVAELLQAQESLQDLVRSLRGDKEELEGVCHRVTAERDAVGATRDKFRVEKVELERQLRESRAKLEEAEAQGRSLSREKDEALSEVSHLKEECQWVETKLAKVQAMANAAPVSNSGGNAALEEVSCRLRSVKDEAATTESKRKGEIDNLQATIRSLQLQLEGSREEASKAKEELKRLMDQHSKDKETMLAGKKVDEGEGRKKTRELENKLEEVRGRLRQAEVQVQELQGQAAKSQKQQQQSLPKGLPPKASEEDRVKAASPATPVLQASKEEGEKICQRVRSLEEDLVSKTEEAVTARREAVLLKAKNEAMMAEIRRLQHQHHSHPVKSPGSPQPACSGAEADGHVDQAWAQKIAAERRLLHKAQKMVRQQQEAIRYRQMQLEVSRRRRRWTEEEEEDEGDLSHEDRMEGEEALGQLVEQLHEAQAWLAHKEAKLQGIEVAGGVIGGEGARRETEDYETSSDDDGDAGHEADAEGLPLLIPPQERVGIPPSPDRTGHHHQPHRPHHHHHNHKNHGASREHRPRRRTNYKVMGSSAPAPFAAHPPPPPLPYMMYPPAPAAHPFYAYPPYPYVPYPYCPQYPQLTLPWTPSSSFTYPDLYYAKSSQRASRDSYQSPSSTTIYSSPSSSWGDSAPFAMIRRLSDDRDRVSATVGQHVNWLQALRRELTSHSYSCGSRAMKGATFDVSELEPPSPTSSSTCTLNDLLGSNGGGGGTKASAERDEQREEQSAPPSLSASFTSPSKAPHGSGSGSGSSSGKRTSMYPQAV